MQRSAAMSALELPGFDTGFNPHPPRTAGATLTGASANAAPVLDKFQSSPAADGGCNWRAPRTKMNITDQSFNPHPPRTAGATSASHVPLRPGCVVSILTRRGRRVQRGCGTRWLLNRRRLVSILTRRGRRVQQYTLSTSACVRVQRRSILTRRGRRVQRKLDSRQRVDRGSCFNPHPPRTAGATLIGVLENVAAGGRMFQSSPAADGGCNWRIRQFT